MSDTADILLQGLPEGSEEAFRRIRLALLDLQDRVVSLEARVLALEASAGENEEGG